MLCLICDKTITTSDLVTCIICKKQYHYHCCGVRKVKWEKLATDEKLKICCAGCRGQKGYDPITEQKSEELLTKMEKRITDIFLSKIGEIAKKMSDIETSMEFLNQMFEENKHKFIDIEEKQKETRKMLNDMQTENSTVKNKVDNVNKELAEIQQRARMSNVEVAGFPETKNENLSEIMADLANHIKIAHNPQDIQIMHRVNSKVSQHRPIVVNFYSREKRNEWVAKARKLRSIKSNDVNKKLAPSTIHIGEHLCPAYKNLLGKSKAAAKSLGDFKFVWFSGGKIRAKKNEESKAYVIECDKDIIKYIGPIPDPSRKMRNM